MVYEGPVIDVDVHHSWRTSDELIDYLPAFWREHLAGGPDGPLPIVPGSRRVLMVDGSNRMDTFPEDGSLPGTDFELLRRQLLEPLRVEKVLLNYEVGLQSGMANAPLATAMCRAANEYTAEHWLPLDERLCGMILVPTSAPEEAAREIAHWAAHERFVGILLVVDALGRPFGHQVYAPIHRAAAECGLPIAIHLSGRPEGRDMAGGNLSLMLERYPLYCQAGMHHLTSMITSGLFERYPSLRAMLLEWGFSWIPSVVRRLDAALPALRRETPEIRRLPSEVVAEHVRFASQPFDYVPSAALAGVLGGLDGFDDLLCFSSDYPHWDADEPTYIASRIPKSWHRKVFHDNAARFFNFKVSSAPAGATHGG
jgi:predicted TIM-barrel fold metal-dependent hydrolase